MAGGKETISLSDIRHPLYIHPSDDPNSVSIEKLQGSANYRSWRRSMEISLASKRKLGFVTGLVTRDKEDTQKQEQWDTCNHIVIACIHGSISEQIKKSIFYLYTAREIWLHLERSNCQTNGSTKYRLNKGVYETKQNGGFVNDYYAKMKEMWEELESLNQLPAITSVIAEITAFVEALQTHKEEQQLFQFLNGLDEYFIAQRSQMLMQSLLTSIETSCSSLQQEESQREILNISKLNIETFAMYNNGASHEGG